MKRPLRPDETRLWAVVAATVRPAPGRTPPAPPPPEPPASDSPSPGPVGCKPAPLLYTARNPRQVDPPATKTSAAPPSPPGTPDGIEPNRRRRIARSRDGLAARLDLHGYGQDQARARLQDFLLQAQAEGARAVLVITGKGFGGEGVLRRRAPEWLADPALREVVAGLSPADDRHGGAGAWYVALKRKPR
jgi:DNA-nicking Smr family endonuclease